MQQASFWRKNNVTRFVLAVSVVLVPALFLLGRSEAGDKDVLSFKGDVFPLIQKHCLPCHAEENFNPSELSMDTYELIVTGGKNGSPIVIGKSAESLLIRKLSEKPPDGERMPLNTKKKIKEGKAEWMPEAEVKVIAAWIDQGAKDN